MKLIAINGRRWSKDVLHDAIGAAQTSQQPIELLVSNKQIFKTYSVAYHGGEKNPHLERQATQADLLGDILKPKAGVAQATGSAAR